MVSTFIATIMKISASVNARQVLPVMLNMASSSDLRCAGKFVVHAQRSLFRFRLNWNAARHNKASVNLVLFAGSPTSGQITDYSEANSTPLLRQEILFLGDLF